MRELLRNIIDNELMTSPEVAEYLGVHPSAVRQMSMKGTVESIKKGPVRLFDIQDIKGLRK